MSTRKILSLLQELLREIAREEIKDIIDIEGYLRDHSKESTKSKPDRVKRELEDRGYLLELEAYNRLRSREWVSTLQEVHWDIESNSERPPHQEYWDDIFGERIEKTEREIDVLAMKSIVLHNKDSFSRATIELVVECKKRTREHWAFYVEQIFDDELLRIMREKKPPFRVGDISSFKMIADFRDRNLNPSLNITEWGSEEFLKQINNVSHHSIMQMSKRGLEGYTLFSGDDSIRKACLKVLDAAIFRHTTYEAQELIMNKAPPSERYWSIYPVIIFDGPIWLVKLNGGKVEVEEATWLSHLLVRKGHDYYVDIVSWSHFDEYLDILDLEVKSTQKFSE